MSRYRIMKLDPYLSPVTKINSKWKNTELLEDTVVGEFFGQDPKRAGNKSKNRKKWDHKPMHNK
jgi:hypothetical protein